MPEERVFPSEEFNEDWSFDLESEPDSLGSMLAQEDEEDVDSIEIMKPHRRKALLEFRCRVEDAILGNYIFGKKRGKSFSEKIEKPDENLSDITLWGVPLLPSKGHEGTDLVLTKFLMARDYRVSDAFENLRKTLKWRREMKIDGILREKFSPDLEDLGYINGMDKVGRPLCYSLYGNFKDKELYKKRFSTQENCEELLRWRIQFMEKCIQTLTFKAGEPDSIIQIIDLKNIGPAIKHARSIARKWLFLAQEHYPGVVFKSIIIYVPLWVFAFHALHLKFLTPRTKRQYVLIRPSRVTETLLKFIAPESLPIQYGGLKRESDDEFSEHDKVLEQNFKGGSTDSVEIYVGQAGETVIWDASVIGNEVSYKEEFVPDDEGSYTVLLKKEKRIMTSVRNSFHIREPGRIVITIENRTYKKKRIYYRFKTKPTVPIYSLSK